MDDQTNEEEVVETVEEEVEEVEEAPEPTDDVETLKARLAKLEEKAIAQRERTRMLRQELQKAKPKAEAPQKQNTGELDETALDYLDLKGISDDDEIAVIQKVVQKTGQTVRQALKDDYVISKLESIRKEKEVKNATPSSTKRSSAGQMNDVAMAVSKFEQSGILPDDFALRTQVVNAIADKNNTNKPRWH